MGMTKKLRGGKFIAFCVLLFCLLIPQAAYAAQGDTVNLTVKQNFTSSVSGTFGYVLTGQNASTPMPSGSTGSTCTLNLTDTATQDISIGYTAAGTYQYTLKADAATLGAGFTRAAEEYTVEVYVTGSAPSLDVAVIIKNKSGAKVDDSDIIFTPGYQPLATGATPDTPVYKTVNGNPPGAGNFTFVLRRISPANAPMPADSSNGAKQITINGSGAGYFGTWNYTKAGIYNYTAAETNTGVSGYSYDNTVYSITDTVTDNNGQLTISRNVTSSSGGSGLTAFSFTNTYTASGNSRSSEPPPSSSSSSSPSSSPRPTSSSSSPRPTSSPNSPDPDPPEPDSPAPPPALSSYGPPASSAEPEPEPVVEEPVIEDGPAVTTETLGDGNTPLSAGRFFGDCPFWSLLSLIMSLIGAAISIIALVIHLKSRRKGSRNDDGQNGDRQYVEYTDEEKEREPKYRRLCNTLLALSVPVGILVGIVFLILDDFTCPMAFINNNTLLVGIIFLVQVILVTTQSIIRRKKAREEYDDDDGIEGTT
jgi:pilin isopeptide linkage protein